MRSLAWLTMGMLAFAQPCRAELVQTSGPATLTIAFPGDQPTIALADTIRVTLAIEGSPALRVQAPLDLPAGSKWVLVERSKAERTQLGPHRVHWRLVYRFAPREPGSVPLQFPNVTIRDADGANHVASWQPIAFKVTTQVTHLDRQTLRGVPDIESLPPPAPVQATWPIWLALATLGSMLVLAWLIWRRWPRRGAAKSPHQQAQYELQRLLALKLPEQGRGERFATLLSLVMRRYVERQLHLPARRRTTLEFLAHLETCTELNADAKQFLRQLLTRCDTVKFAGLTMPAAECQQWADRVKHFLKQQAGQGTKANQDLPVEKIGQTG